MKTTAVKQATPPRFDPVVVTITLETQQELDAFAKLFNFAPITDTMKQMGFQDPRFWESLGALGADTNIDEFERILKNNIR